MPLTCARLCTLACPPFRALAHTRPLAHARSRARRLHAAAPLALSAALTLLSVVPAGAAAGAAAGRAAEPGPGHGTAATALNIYRPIQPGAPVVTTFFGRDWLCTQSFVFRQGTRRFVGTAGHCVGPSGGRARTLDGMEFGTVVFSRPEPLDFGLIEIDRALYGLVSPAVRAVGGPTGVATSSQTSPGDTILVEGAGARWDLAAVPNPRPGVLIGQSSQRYLANAPTVPGDSGAPIVHAPSGRALGVVSRFNVRPFNSPPWEETPPSTDIGPTVQRIITVLRESGFSGIELMTASYPGSLP